MEPDRLAGQAEEVPAWEATALDPGPVVAVSVPVVERRSFINRESLALIKIVRNAVLKW
jgi:hypothetical protein